MKQTITENDFVSAFADCGREDNFSVEGRLALSEFITDLDEQCEPETELDVVALCCEFSEWENLEEFQQNYGSEYESMQDISDNTLLIQIDDERFITQDF